MKRLIKNGRVVDPSRGTDETLDVRIVAGQGRCTGRVAPNDQGIHRAQGLCIRGDAVQQRQHRLFVRHRYVGAAEAEGRQAPHGRLDLAAGHRQWHIAPGQAQGFKGRVVHDRRQAVLHRPAHDAHQLRRAIDHETCPPNRATFASKPGKESAMQFTSCTRVSPWASRPATAKAMARRWSP